MTLAAEIHAWLKEHGEQTADEIARGIHARTHDVRKALAADGRFSGPLRPLGAQSSRSIYFLKGTRRTGRHGRTAPLEPEATSLIPAASGSSGAPAFPSVGAGGKASLDSDGQLVLAGVL